ncbi:AraC family transcriptional regulator [Maribacter algicola]|uniref:AraC family transcriptional regulator n=1 Tax=Maribacter algicola TaxID=2498892 RepID=A0A3R8WDK3_9FLAO|nr:AraC family transcriptional regulator [Maribacter algicola]RRQ48011.1 AraC family transcriptional regulator [Maribacter algicola]
MKLHFIDRKSSVTNSLSVTRNSYPHFLKLWHFHPELELVMIIKSTGTRFVGDSIEKFNEGEVVLLGKNLPHMWINDPDYYTGNTDMIAEAIAVHFKKEFLGDTFFEVPEMLKITNLIHKASLGMVFTNVDNDLRAKIKSLVNLRDFEKVITLLQILQELAEDTQARILSSNGFIKPFNQDASQDLEKIYEYIYKNFNKPISSRKVAEIANMNSSAFSRFFTKIHRKSFTRYLNEIRIGYACKMLIEGEQKIISICYESGFRNVSNFNRQFKLIRGITPNEFAKIYNNESELI